MHKKTTALVASTGVAGLIAGGVLMATMSANAADDSASSSSGSYAMTGEHGPPPGNQNTDPTKPMRSDEKLLTGTALEKVTAAVKAKYPDATIQRVETDSDGVYEAHILDNGKPVTVELDKAYAITGTESAPTGGRGDQDGDRNAA